MKKIYISFLLLLFAFELSFAQTDFFEKGTLNFKLYGGKALGSSYFDLEGKVKTEYTEISPDTILFNYEEYTYGFRAEYSVTDNFTLFTEIPLKYYSLQQKKDTTYFDSLGSQYATKKNAGDYSLFQPAYYAIGVRYLPYKKFSYLGLLSEVRIPSGFHNGIQNDPDYNFLSDGALEVHAGLMLGVKFAKSWMESQIIYKFRGEDLSDMLFIHTEIGLSTVPGTKLMGFFDFAQSFGSYDNPIIFDPKKTTLIENSFDVGVYFSMFVTDNIYGDFTYKINLLGKNTMNMGGYFIGFGVKL